LKGHHVAFKVKFDAASMALHVEGKSNAATLLNCLTEEIEALPL
jgi:hypothetical protein